MKDEAGRRMVAERAYALFDEFRAAYAGEWERLAYVERMYRGEHWHDVPRKDANEPRPVMPILQSTVENVAADLMDQFPEAVITPETAEDHGIARVVEALIRQNHDAAGYVREYRKLAHDLLVSGYMVQEVGFDPLAAGGVGSAYIRHVDVRGVLFDPLVAEIQEGRAVFKFTTRPREWFEQHYPEAVEEMRADPFSLAEFQEDSGIRGDYSKSLLMLEYWWREFDAAEGRHRVHMAQLAGGVVLSDSRETKPEGYFAHGQYPFLATPLFPRKGSALGLGLVDLFGTQQRYADKLDQIVLKNALMASHNKLLVTEASGFDIDDLRDWAKDVHRGESLGGVTWFATPPLPAYLMNYIAGMRNAIKEESGANDFSRGGTMGGVTAASAIAALQEASSKRARMAARQMHEAFRDAVRLEIETEREFGILPRDVMITEDGVERRARFESGMLARGKLPIEFYISIKIQRENRWSVLAQNELVLEMLGLGVLEPDQAVELMHFEGRELVLRRMAERREAHAAQATQARAAQAAAQADPGPDPERGGNPEAEARATIERALAGDAESRARIERTLGGGGLRKLQKAAKLRTKQKKRRKNT